MGELRQTVEIAATNDDYPKGWHEGNPGGLSAVDTDLTPANIKQGVTIFGKAGTLGPGGTETIELYWNGILAAGATYTPAVSGIFSNAWGIRGTPEYYSAGGGAWYPPYAHTAHQGAMGLGDGANFRTHNYHGSNSYEQCLFRHYYSSATYERASDGSLAAGAAYTPSTSGFFATGGQNVAVEMQGRLATAGWSQWRESLYDGVIGPAGLGIGDGTNLRVNNTGASAYRYVLMRAKLT